MLLNVFQTQHKLLSTELLADKRWIIIIEFGNSNVLKKSYT